MSRELLDLLCVVVPILGVAYAASFIWLVVRLINRRERWAKRLAISLVAMQLAYVMSFGPVARVESRGELLQSEKAMVEVVYFPFCMGLNFGPQWMRSSIIWYLQVWDAW